jgi:pSer/pThr/pTyr-binding forkhead associated (FHA) protein
VLPLPRTRHDLGVVEHSPWRRPGEVYNEAILYYLKQVVAAGGFVEGATNQSLSEFSCRGNRRLNHAPTEPGL